MAGFGWLPAESRHSQVWSQSRDLALRKGFLGRPGTLTFVTPRALIVPLHEGERLNCWVGIVPLPERRFLAGEMA